jgi:hypothetical protein
MYKTTKDYINILTTINQPKYAKIYLSLKVIQSKMHIINNFFTRESSNTHFYSGKGLFYAK